MEAEFGLVKLERTIPPLTIRTQKITYGQSDTKRSIRDVLVNVYNQYRFTSLTELNAVLSLYNVKADGGREDSKLHKHRGLLYRVLDENGNTIGIPLKASTFDFKPILNNLEKKFVLNAPLQEPHRQRVTTAIDWTLATKSHDLSTFRKSLEKERISAVLQQDKSGVLQGIQYVDHQAKCVFDGASLGSKYDVQSIRERCEQTQVATQKQSQTHRHRLRLGL